MSLAWRSPPGLTHFARLTYAVRMTTTDFAPITLNGEAVATWRTATEIVLNGRLYFVEFSASDECSCRRCMLHDDFGGCIVDAALWGLVTFLADA